MIHTAQILTLGTNGRKLNLVVKSGISWTCTFRVLYPDVIAHHVTSFVTSIQDGSSIFVVLIKSMVSVFANKTCQIVFFWIRLCTTISITNQIVPIQYPLSQPGQKRNKGNKQSKPKSSIIAPPVGGQSWQRKPKANQPEYAALCHPWPRFCEVILRW